MKVQVVKNYHDRLLRKDVKVGDELEVTEERANVLINAGVATPTTPTEKVVKKPRAKKEA